jgi:hypothetical protein
MKIGLTILIGFMSILVIFGVIGCSVVISINNTCVEHEATIKAQYKQNQNNYDNYFKKVQEMAQIPTKYANDMKEMWDKVMMGRYGKNGSKAMWQWLKEQNPQLNPDLYIKVQRTIEAGRIDFETNQKMLLDKKRIYEDSYLNKFPSGAVAKMLGFPKIDLSKMDIVISDETQKVFKTKKSKTIKVF